MSIQTRLKSAETKLNVGSGVLWDDVSLAQFIEESSTEEAEMSPGSERLNLYTVLSAAPTMLAEDHPGRDWRADWLGYLSLTEAQCDRETIDARCYQMATEAHFNGAEMRHLRKTLRRAWLGVARSLTITKAVEEQEAKAAARPQRSPELEPEPVPLAAPVVDLVPKPTPGSVVAPGEFYDMPGFGSIQID
jgi:hypothetical protein